MSRHQDYWNKINQIPIHENDLITVVQDKKEKILFFPLSKLFKNETEDIPKVSRVAAIEEAKKSGNWDTPKQAPVSDSQIEILVKALEGVEPALSNFLKMSTSIRRTYTAAYLDAKKEETRIRRLESIIRRLNDNKKPM